MKHTLQKQTLILWLEKYSGIFYKVVRAYSHQPHDQEDLFQEIATQLWKAIPRFRGDSKESTFIYQVALYTALSWTRKERRRKEEPSELKEADCPIFHSYDDQVNPRLEWLYESIREMNTSDRSLTLLLLDGLSYGEIAEILGISANNVGVKLSRIKNKLTDISRKEKENGL